ncbi:MAG: hypothetical protein Q9162_000048 [Coniocarpon cinnabarinum]
MSRQGSNDQPTTAPVPPSSPPQPQKPTVQPPEIPPYAPSFLWRLCSTVTVGAAGGASRIFLKALNKVEVNGLDRFLRLLDERKDTEGREKGLITGVSMKMETTLGMKRLTPAKVSNHLSVFTSTFFTLGQCLPTHRIQHSPYGGLWQPTMTEAVRLLSSQPFARPDTLVSSPMRSSILASPRSAMSTPPADPLDLADPFSNPAAPALHPTYSTTGADSFPAPTYHPSRRHAWIHIFPEGRIHQHPTQTMRYFRWGVSRLILEAEPCPDVVPVWIEGFQDVMSEKRDWPRPLPRPGKLVRVDFGEVVAEAVWDGYRRKWRELVEESKRRRRKERQRDREGNTQVIWHELGVVEDDWLKYGREAVELRTEVADRVRQELVKMRSARGWPEEDARARLASTWRGGKNGLLQDVGEDETNG